MSQPQPSKNAAMMQFLLLACTIFLGFQLFSGAINTKPETRSSDQIRTNLVELNRMGKDILIQQEVKSYDHVLGEAVKSNKLTAEERERKSLEAHILSAQVSLRAGLWLKDYGRVNTAYMQMDTLRNQYGTKPIWKEKFAVAPLDNVLTDKELSGEVLYEASRDSLSSMSKRDRIMGFIPGYDLIDSLVALTGRQPAVSYTFAAFLLAILVRAIVWPLAQKQLMFSRQMMQLKPLIDELKNKHTKNGVLNQMEFQQDTMKLYSEYGINPAKGCMPALLQMPFFLLIFQCMMHYRFEFEKGTFLWVNPSSHASVPFFAPNLGKMDTLLLIVYAVSMVATTMMQPVTDPTQAKQQRGIGIAVSVIVAISMFFFPLPSAFVLYWIFLNIFSTFQSWRAYRLPIPPLQKVQTAYGGVKPRSGFFEKMMEQQQAMLQQQQEAQANSGNKGSNNNKGQLYKPKGPTSKKK